MRNTTILLYFTYTSQVYFPYNKYFSFSFQDLYRVLLEAESEGILDDVDMAKVEKLILDPKHLKG